VVTKPAKDVVSDPISTELKKVMRQLKLSPMLDTLPDRLALARQHHLSHAAFLELVLADEATRRDTSSAARRARAAGLDPAMRLDTWDESAAVRYDRTLWTDLTSLRFLDASHGAVILGAVGVGKTHLATALGHIAVRRRIPTLMLRSDAMFKQLKASRLDNSTEAEMRRLAQVRLLIIDLYRPRNYPENLFSVGGIGCGGGLLGSCACIVVGIFTGFRGKRAGHRVAGSGRVWLSVVWCGPERVP
jgi:DNA replication protein DnaC